MSQYVQESDFDARLKRIGDLYESGKDCVNSIICYDEDSREAKSKLLDILRDLRDISATSLKANYQVKDN